MISDYFSPEVKGRDGCSLGGPRQKTSPFPPTLAPAPQCPNPPSRRMLALQNPETYNTGKPGPRQPSARPQEPAAFPDTKRRAKPARPEIPLNTRTGDGLKQAPEMNKETQGGSPSGENLSGKICHKHQDSASLNGQQSHMSLKRRRCPQDDESGERRAKRPRSWNTAPRPEQRSSSNAGQADSRTKFCGGTKTKSRHASSPTVSAGSARHTKLGAAGAPLPPSFKALHPKIFIPIVKLERLKPDDCPPRVGNGPLPSAREPRKETRTSPNGPLAPDGAQTRRDCTSKAGASTSEGAATSSHRRGRPTQSDSPKLRGDDKDPLGLELDLDLDLDLGLELDPDPDPDLDLDLDLTQSSKSSDDEPLISFQEMMERSAKPPETPVKGSVSEPPSPTLSSPQLRPLPQMPRTKPGNYKNSLDRMLQDIKDNKRSRETEKELIHTFEEDLLKITELDDSGESQDEALLPEQKEFLQSYSLLQNLLRDVHPGEVVFSKECRGLLFSQDTLLLGQREVKAQGREQNTFLWSSPGQFRLHVISGFLEEAYGSSPCPQHIARFLFRMMSVHRERMISEQIFAALKTISCAAYQMATSGGRQREAWVPSVADLTQVLMNMGIPYATLFPLESVQPAFTEGDLVKDTQINTTSPSTHTEPTAFPEHNFKNVLKYVADCMELCPLAYSDPELLLLLTVTSVIGLDTQLCLRPNQELYSLQHHIVSSIRDWDAMLPRICLALTGLTEHHHNMCWLVKLLPVTKRGLQLRKHLSLCLISKLLNGSCTYKPTKTDFQLSDLQPYLILMRPSSLHRLLNSSGKQKAEDSFNTLDQEAYYLCFNLLTLANEASNVQSIQPRQREQLLALSSVLERRIKNDIRESEKCLYRTKVKDFVTRIYIKWEKLILKTRHLQKTLYHYFKPADDLESGKEAEEDKDEEVDAVTEEEEGGEEMDYKDMSEEESEEISMDTETDGDHEESAEKVGMKANGRAISTGE